MTSHVSSVAAVRRWMLVAAVVGFGLRAAFGSLYWVDKPLTHDEREYLALADSIRAGRGFSYDASEIGGTAPQFGRAPGYPAFLALIGAGSKGEAHSPWRVKIAQSAIGGVTVWLIGAIALRAAGRRAGLAAAALAAVYPPLVWISAYVFSETLYSLVALLAARVLQLAVDRDLPPEGGSHKALVNSRATRLACVTGGLAGVAILIRPAMLVFLPLAAIWLIARGQVRLAATLLLTAALVVAPWTIRNARVHDRFVLVASEGGVTFWTGNHPLARGEGDLAANPGLKLAEIEFRRAHPGLSAEALEPLYYRAAWQWIAAHPLDWVVLIARKAFFTVVPLGPSYTLHSTRYWIASLVSYLLVLPLAVLGFPRLWRSLHRPTAVLLLGTSAVIVGLIFFPQERFRIPVIDPVLILSASAVVAGTTRSGRGGALA
jgi:hypothetical protein